MGRAELETFQEELQTLRKAAGLKQSDLALKLGTSAQTISNLENHRYEISQMQYDSLMSIFMKRAKMDEEFRRIFFARIECDGKQQEDERLEVAIKRLQQLEISDINEILGSVEMGATSLGATIAATPFSLIKLTRLICHTMFTCLETVGSLLDEEY